MIETSKATVLHFKEDRLLECFCSENCSRNIRIINPNKDDGWRGCSECSYFVCNKKICQSRLIKHNEFCLYKSIFYVNKKQKITNQNIIDEVKSIASVS
jgi:hypothetical protein